MSPLVSLPAYDAIMEPDIFIWISVLLVAIIAGAAGFGFWLGRRFAKPQLVAEVEERKQAEESMRESAAWLNAYKEGVWGRGMRRSEHWLQPRAGSIERRQKKMEI